MPTGQPVEPTVAELLSRLEDVHDRGVKFGDRFISWSAHMEEADIRGRALRSLLDPTRPPHIGILLDNVPEFSYLLAAAARHGIVVVGLNSTRRGDALARDVAVSDCRLVISSESHRPLWEAVRGAGVDVFDIAGDPWKSLLSSSGTDSHRRPDTRPAPEPDDLMMLIFTSGTSGDPKAVRCTQGKIAQPGYMLADRFELGSTDTVYVSMPMFHSNAIMAGWAVGIASGGSIAFREKFSASQFIPDVRRFDATYANYVGTPLSYVLRTPPSPFDRQHSLRVVYGNEGRPDHIAEFGRRFGVAVVDGFGSTEGGVAIARTPDTPSTALGRITSALDIVDTATGEPCPIASFDDSGRLLNAAEATGELVSTEGAGAFRGYYGDPAADAERMRGGRYHSGDLAYRDGNGFVYFAGRVGDWLRVDGENLGAAPIERILLRYGPIREAAVYPVQDGTVGDVVMVALVVDDRFDPSSFSQFLSRQSDLGPKQWPSLVRLTRTLSRTASHKVVKRALSAEGTQCTDAVWSRDGHRYTPLRREHR